MPPWFTTLTLLMAAFICKDQAADPGCQTSPVSDTIASLTCVGIDNTNLDQLLSELDILAANNILVNLELRQSAVTDLPVDFLKGYSIRSLSFYDDGLVTFPDAILANVNSQLLVLDLSRNSIADLTKENFDRLPFAASLEILVISNNELTTLPNENVFQALTNLRRLQLPFNNIDKVLDNTFANLDALADLHLYANNIDDVHVDAFGTLPNLTRLYLNENRISTLSEGTFSTEKLPRILRFYLGNNPFNCNCSLQWFKTWLDSQNVTFESDATCQYPRLDPFAFVEFCPANIPVRVQTWMHYQRKLYVDYVENIIIQDPREREFRQKLNDKQGDYSSDQL